MAPIDRRNFLRAGVAAAAGGFAALHSRILQASPYGLPVGLELYTVRDELAKTDRNGRLAGRVAPLANWAGDERNGLTRPLMEKIAGIDRHANLPKFHGTTFVMRARQAAPGGKPAEPGSGRADGKVEAVPPANPPAPPRPAPSNPNIDQNPFPGRPPGCYWGWLFSPG